MVNIFVEIDNYGILRKIKANGHSGFKTKGKDIVCTGVSTLIQTMDLSMRYIPSIEYKVFDEEIYSLEIMKFNVEVVSELRGMTIFLITGLRAISEKYKKNVTINIIKELKDGTS